MSFFEQVINKVFSKNATNTASQKPIRVQEKLVYTEKFLSEFEEWKSRSETSVWLDFLKQSLKLQFNGIDGPQYIQTFSMDATRGFAVLNKEETNDKRLTFLLHHIYGKLKEIGYIPQKSGRSIEDRSSYVHIQEGYYMKPNVYLGMGKSGKALNQLYGNITLELVSADQRNSYLKVVTTWYHDHNFDAPEPYEDLLESLFTC